MGGSLASGWTPRDSHALAARIGQKSVSWNKSAHAPETAQEFLRVSSQKSLPAPNHIHSESEIHIPKTFLRADRGCSNLRRPSAARRDLMTRRVTSSPLQEPQQHRLTHCFRLLQKDVFLPIRRFFPHYPTRAYYRSRHETNWLTQPRAVVEPDFERNQIHSDSPPRAADYGNGDAARHRARPIPDTPRARHPWRRFPAK